MTTANFPSALTSPRKYHFERGNCGYRTGKYGGTGEIMFRVLLVFFSFSFFLSKSMLLDERRTFMARCTLHVARWRHSAKVDRFIDSACPRRGERQNAIVGADFLASRVGESLRVSALLGPTRNFRKLCHLSQSSFKESRYLKEKRVIPAKNSRVRARDSLAFFPLLTTTFRWISSVQAPPADIRKRATDISETLFPLRGNLGVTLCSQFVPVPNFLNLPHAATCSEINRGSL